MLHLRLFCIAREKPPAARQAAWNLAGWGFSLLEGRRRVNAIYIIRPERHRADVEVVGDDAVRIRRWHRSADVELENVEAFRLQVLTEVQEIPRRVGEA